jgi:hypothetical protein
MELIEDKKKEGFREESIDKETGGDGCEASSIDRSINQSIQWEGILIGSNRTDHGV